MNRMFRKYVCAILFLVLAFSLIPINSVNAQDQEVEVYYGEAYLDLQTDALRTAYQLVEEAIASLAPRITFQGVVEINYKQLQDVLRAVCVDHPQYFWFLETGTYVHEDVDKGGKIVTFDPTYILDGEEVAVGSQELADAMYAFHTKLHEIVQSIPVNLTTDYEIALYLHDYLAEHVTYTIEGEHPSAYAALIHGEAACYGYSKAYQCLLNAAGIRARTITGTCPDGNGKLAGHAWNQVWLDGKCYYTDVTWDDYDEFVHHAYFAISLQAMSEEHFADPEFILPECGHDDADYYTRSAGNGVAKWTGSGTVQEAAAWFRFDGFTENGAMFVCEVRHANNGFLTWLGKQYREIFRKIGLGDNAELYYYTMMDVYYLVAVDPNYQMSTSLVTQITLNAQTVTLPGQGTSFKIQPQVQASVSWMPELFYQSSDESVVTVDGFGIVKAVSEGTAVITVSSADGAVSATCTVTVESAPEHVHSMRMFSSKDPTCVQDGYESHYLCTGCGIRFADEAGTQPLLKTVDFIISATGHLEYSWEGKFNYHVYKCTCGYEQPNTMANHSDADGDHKCDVCQILIAGSKPSTSNGGQNNGISQQNKKLPGWVRPAIAAISVILALIVYLVIRRRRKY